MLICFRCKALGKLVVAAVFFENAGRMDAMQSHDAAFSRDACFVQRSPYPAAAGAGQQSSGRRKNIEGAWGSSVRMRDACPWV